MKRIIVSISPQSIASLAVKQNLDFEKCAKKLCGLFKKHFDAEYVHETTFARDFSLYESQLEFVERFQQSKNLPILSSSCPGFICYAEKSHGSFILPVSKDNELFKSKYEAYCQNIYFQVHKHSKITAANNGDIAQRILVYKIKRNTRPNIPCVRNAVFR